MLGICFIDKFSIKTLAIVERLGTYYKFFSAVIKTGNQNKRKRMERFEALRQLLSEDRSIRRFEQSRRIGMEILTELVDLTRFCASGRNMQPLRYRIVDSEADCAMVYPLLAWAGYFKDWDGPEEGERPSAYLVQCLDTRYGSNCLCDDGLQLQALTLGARSLGIGACIIKAFNAPELKRILNLPDGIEPRYVLALGYPAEKPIIVDTDGTPDADIRYYRTPDGVHHVPKRPLSEIIL